MRDSIFIALFSTCATCSLAEPLTGQAFDAYTQGKTLFFNSHGQPYGAETYLRNRRVRWSYLDGDCKEGHWFPVGAQICFVYDGNDTPQCWNMNLSDSGLSAIIEDESGRTELNEAAANGREQICPGPDVGV
ncbi:hypothetical protein GG681_12180 [Epibacterium sp. SM1969]|uniref:Uncharacterized protein n=1 Tax=Tritonibacter aquimaris TaxID=2663379 RepID=A0A844AR19_9RHOB|nr:hypothetical protein [Tritonibacter aquimaris]MQY43403.1 hypothetical protein [Tritonibacter aquimaris]